MATIVIKDLPDSVELDRIAMLAITGGARVRARAGAIGSSPMRAKRLFDYAASLAGKPPPRTTRPSA